ncbi:MAG: pyridoxal phosphate-dependent aminotransferase [SAR202 cluster bacterium]|nr:pyridoxal phosphate-dependent aminotransferase [SAR202 cluster bacterium]
MGCSLLAQLASRQAKLGTETAFETLAKAKELERQGKSIIHLEIGEPDFDTPLHIRDAAKKALDDGFTHYGPSAGQLELRESIAKHQTERQGYDVRPDNVIVTPGGKPVMFFTIMAMIEKGDEVIYPNPGFPIYESMIRYMGGTPVPMQLNEESGYNTDIDDFKSLVTPRTKLIIVNSPNNPCGSVIPETDLQQIAEIAIENDIIVMADEIYKDMYYGDQEHVSITKFPGMRDRTVILDGFSKSYAMTGWRLGYGVFPDFLVEPVVRLMTNSVSCTSVFSQMAAVAALEGPQDSVRMMMEEFTKRRDLVVQGLNSLPDITCPEPKGAFYAFPNIRSTGLSSEEFAEKAMYDAGVALLAGTAFGRYGDGYVRISFANSQKNLREAIERLRQIL